MGENKKKRDIISEQEFNEQRKNSSTDPTLDSPADSTENFDSEIQMGLNYMPDEKNEYDTSYDKQQEIPVFDRKSGAPSEIPRADEDMAPSRIDKISPNAKVVDSDLVDIE